MQDFLERATKIHEFKYDYSKVNYVNDYAKVIIGCLKHGDFLQRPENHLKGRGCKHCSTRTKKYTTEMFIEKARRIHGLKYDYSLVRYIDSYTRVTIICPLHGKFEQIPGNHLQRRGCTHCQNYGAKLTPDSFKTEARLVHGLKYDYSKISYVNKSVKVIIICPEHGEFFQSPNCHLNGKGCKKCAVHYTKYTLQNFIEKATLKHDFKYDYSKVIYVNSCVKVTIICPEHGEFSQRPDNHIQGHGCVNCYLKTKTVLQI